MREVRLPETLTSIGTSAFYHCTALEEITIPANVREFGQNAFQYSGLRSISLPEGLSEISSGLFSYCEQLVQVTLPSSVKKIESYAFGGCKRLKDISLPEGLQELGGCAFCDCESLESIKLPRNISGLESMTFAQCRQLNEVDIPETTTFISSNAFQNCVGLKRIICRAVVPPESDYNLFHFSFLNYAECTLYIPIGTTEAYKASPNFKDFLNICETDFHTDINSIQIDTKQTRVYSLDGKALQPTRKGLNILRQKDGKHVKIIR